jgi:hypothetical protein
MSQERAVIGGMIIKRVSTAVNNCSRENEEDTLSHFHGFPGRFCFFLPGKRGSE